jgi:hypothetical protein
LLASVQIVNRSDLIIETEKRVKGKDLRVKG